MGLANPLQQLSIPNTRSSLRKPAARRRGGGGGSGLWQRLACLACLARPPSGLPSATPSRPHCLGSPRPRWEDGARVPLRLLIKRGAKDLLSRNTPRTVSVKQCRLILGLCGGCLPAWLSACVLACQLACLSACLRFSLPACLSTCLPVSLPACVSACLPAYQLACLSTCLSACLSACLPVNLSVCLPVSLPASQPVCLPDCQPASLH